MGDLRHPKPVLLLLALISRDPKAIAWAQCQAIETWGPLALESEPFRFDETDYYEATMGRELKKKFLAFQSLVDPGELVDVKRLTNEWERVYAESPSQEPASAEVVRPLNLDPGYISEAKLVLASTKDHAHRIYLGQGIYAEVTLHFHKAVWQARDWTYPDYRRDDYRQFFTHCRDYLRRTSARGVES